MGKIVVAILAVFLLLGAFATPINDGIKTWRTDDTTQNEVVVTGAGETSANVTLERDLYQDDTAEVISISSNTTETPVATSYTSATNVLLVSALNAEDTRVLTINYYAETESEVMRALGPFLAVLIFGCLLFAIGFGALKHKR